ncbi:hypothetical protein [Agriterribacter humi]|uniref:hypothetical protein n=1 Tax=Agriterribacter humi TaxID=1104781 RepID=UPI00186B13B8|nr:hypothetical protein [Agriterribacter humi]
MGYTANNEGCVYPYKRSFFLKKEARFSKKIWQQIKAGYLCAPLLKKAVALKKINDDYA